MLNIPESGLGQFASQVRELASLHGGRCTWVFSIDDPLLAPLTLSPTGVRCNITRMLSASWLVEHASGDGLAAALGASEPGDGGSEDRRPGAERSRPRHVGTTHFNSMIRRMVQHALMARELRPLRITGQALEAGGTPSEFVAMDYFYSSRGLYVRDVDTANFSANHETVRHVVQILDGFSAQRDGAYVDLLVQSNDGPHGMAAWLSRDRVVFFDPRYGEFEWRDFGLFGTWLHDYFSVAENTDGIDIVFCMRLEYRPPNRFMRPLARAGNEAP